MSRFCLKGSTGVSSGSRLLAIFSASACACAFPSMKPTVVRGYEYVALVTDQLLYASTMPIIAREICCIIPILKSWSVSGCM